jgi:hypothetical protein
LTTGYSGAQAARFERLTLWDNELLGVIDRSKPEGEFVGKVVAGPAGSIALNERGCAEIF